ncbi:MAG: hypothetical protein RSE47_03355 [Acidaminococcaceae bacterium]
MRLFSTLTSLCVLSWLLLGGAFVLPLLLAEKMLHERKLYWSKLPYCLPSLLLLFYLHQQQGVFRGTLFFIGAMLCIRLFDRAVPRAVNKALS